MHTHTPRKKIGIAAFIVVAILGFATLTMLLWNWLIPAIFNGPSITFLQAIGLLILSKILFSGGPGRHRHSHHSHGGPYWKRQMRERMESNVEEPETPTNDIS